MNKQMLKNPLILLDREDLVSALKKHWKANHENLRDPDKFVADFFDYLLQVRNDGDLVIREINRIYNKKLKEYWRDGLKAQKPKDMFLEIAEKRLDRAETVLDFGCGKLAFLKELAENNQDMKKLIGFDPKSQPVLDGLDRRIKFRRDIEELQKASVDAVVIKLVLHHLEGDEQIRDIFRSIEKVLRPGGKLIVFEESFPESSSGSVEIEKYLSQFSLKASESTEDFLRLSQEDKINFLFLNDWLMNMQNSYMPWTGQYKSMEQWKELAESFGFKEAESHFLGAIKHRKRKQGMTAYMVFEKK